MLTQQYMRGPHHATTSLVPECTQGRMKLAKPRSAKSLFITAEPAVWAAAFGGDFEHLRYRVTGTPSRGFCVETQPHGRYGIGATPYGIGLAFPISGMADISKKNAHLSPIFVDCTSTTSKVKSDPFDWTPLITFAKESTPAVTPNPDIRKTTPVRVERFVEPPLETRPSVSEPVVGLKAIRKSIRDVNEGISNTDFPISLSIQDGKLIALVELS